jgi:hypothetical protein
VVTIRGWPLWLGIGLYTHVVKWRYAVVDQFGKVLACQFVEIKEVVLEVPFHMLMSSREPLAIPWCTIVDEESKHHRFVEAGVTGMWANFVLGEAISAPCLSFWGEILGLTIGGCT